jgi:hypothetical protein
MRAQPTLVSVVIFALTMIVSTHCLGLDIEVSFTSEVEPEASHAVHQ